jgi:very-short-patch-repair endonuclease
MQQLVPVLVMVTVVLMLALLALLQVLPRLLKRPKPTAEQLPYRRKDYLLSRTEREFYERLIVAVAGLQIAVFAKVRLEDLLWLPKGTANRQGHRNRVQSKHVDFVLCDRRDLRPVLVIELDDASHERQDRRTRDALVNEILSAAGLPILHVKARWAYDAQSIARQVIPLLEAVDQSGQRTQR